LTCSIAGKVYTAENKTVVEQETRPIKYEQSKIYMQD